MDLNSLTLGGKTYDSFPDTNARERLTDVEYQTVTTDLAFEHKDLPIGEKTVTVNGDGTWGDTVYVSSGEDLVPRTTFNRKFPYNGITVEKNGYTYHLSGTATANAQVFLTHIHNDIYSENVRDLGGQTVKLVILADKIWGSSVRIFMQFFDENKTDLSGQIKKPINQTTNVFDITVPENTVYMTIWFQIASGTVLDNDIQVYLNLAKKTQASTDFKNIAVNDDESNYVMSFPYESTVEVKAPIGAYIDYQTAKAKGDTVTYLTPEAFGAVGDGYADDIEAIKACIAKAAETRQAVFMAKKYLISAPIDINGNDFNIIINDIVYSGTDTAVKIHGQRNTIKIHSITSSGIGVKFLGDGTQYSEWTLYNDLDVNAITAASHGIVFESSTVPIYQNNIHFSCIKAGGDGCNGIACSVGEGTYITENNIYGGHISNCDWACYSVAGNSRLMNIQVEGDVKGGFYITDNVSIVKPRWAESWRDGEYPFLKFACPSGQNHYITVDSGVALPISEIDLTDNGDTTSNEAPATESLISVLNCPIIPKSFNVGEDVNTSSNYTHRAYVWGKYLIMTPFMAYRKEVTTATLDTRLIGKEKTEAEIQALAQLPTKFVVNSTNTEIYLHESYCAFGFNEFEVEQANGFTCKVYDKLNNLIFDGAEQGDGLYKLNVYKDATYCASRLGLLRVDFLGHYWSVTKQVTVNDILAALPIAEEVDF